MAMYGQIDTLTTRLVSNKPLILIDNIRNDDTSDTARKQSRISLRDNRPLKNIKTNIDERFPNILSQLPYIGNNYGYYADIVPRTDSELTDEELTADALLTRDLARMLQAKFGLSDQPKKKEKTDPKLDEIRIFPPVHAPEPVKRAWESATVSMDVAETTELKSLFHDTIDINTLQPTPTVFSANTDYLSMVDRLIHGEKYLQTVMGDGRTADGSKLILALERFKEALSAHNV